MPRRREIHFTGLKLFKKMHFFLMPEGSPNRFLAQIWRPHLVQTKSQILGIWCLDKNRLASTPILIFAPICASTKQNHQAREKLDTINGCQWVHCTVPSRTWLGVLHRVIDAVRKFGQFLTIKYQSLSELLTELHWAAETAIRGWKCN